MKIIHTKTPVSADEFQAYLAEKLNPLFQKQRQLDMEFEFIKQGDTINIVKTDLYDGFLFSMQKANDTEWHITKSEHYTDDVNVLTLEDILNNLYLEFPGRDNIDLIEERS
jgi:hypothetical protein